MYMDTMFVVMCDVLWLCTRTPKKRVVAYITRTNSHFVGQFKIGRATTFTSYNISKFTYVTFFLCVWRYFLFLQLIHYSILFYERWGYGMIYGVRVDDVYFIFKFICLRCIDGITLFINFFAISRCHVAKHFYKFLWTYFFPNNI